MNSSNNEKCVGCKYITGDNSSYCYMFETSPEILPCAQHDMYAEQRKINGKKIADKYRNSN